MVEISDKKNKEVLSLENSNIKPKTRYDELPFKQNPSVKGANVGYIMMVFGGLIGIVLALLFFVRKKLVSSGQIPDHTGGLIKLLDRNKLNVNTTTYLVEVDNQRFFTVESENGQSVVNLSPVASSWPIDSSSPIDSFSKSINSSQIDASVSSIGIKDSE
ncbi:MAG: hypothetical protein JKY54_12935 [Flavobacteriales bacterium]|nr:hypothetical protein [Flavobacteriales bacterium]